MLTKAPRGTKDVLPKDSFKWTYVENLFRDICANYGFNEIRTPIFEHTELFKRGVGETTDIVQKEMYSFEDNGGRDITLKPEGTAPVVRAFIENKLYAEALPVKLCYITPCFRYERPQAGRLRAFHQFGIEAFGTQDPLMDAEIIAVAMDFFKALRVDNLELRINSIGCPECRKQYKQVLKDYLAPILDELCETCRDRYEKNPMRILDCKIENCRQLTKDAPRILDSLCESCKEDFELLKNHLKLMKIDYIVDADIVRGLDYYTKTAFEIISKEIGSQGTVCGGGRYDNLIEQLGGPATPGVGFGMGIERLLLTLENNNIDLPDETATEVFIVTMDESTRNLGVSLLHEMRVAGISGEMDLVNRNVKGQFKHANRLNAKYTVVIGPDELEANSVNVKNMEQGTQEAINIENLIDYLKKSL